MQEEVDEKTVALMINGGRISADILKSALSKLLQQIDEKNRITEETKKEKTKAAQAKKEAKKEAGKAAKKAAREAKKNEPRPGRKTLNSMMKEGGQLTKIEITGNNIQSFEKVARKYSIDYSLMKDGSANPPKYLVFFRAKDVDVMTTAFREYTGGLLNQPRKASIRKRLQRAISRTAKHRELEKTRQKTRQPER